MPQGPDDERSFWDRVFYPRGNRSSSSSKSGGGGKYAWPAMYQPSFWERVLYPEGFPGQDPNKARMNKYGYADTGASDAVQKEYARSVDDYLMKTTADEAFRPGAAEPSKPVTKLSSTDAIANRMQTALAPAIASGAGETGGFPEMPDYPLFGGRNPGETGGEPDITPPMRSPAISGSPAEDPRGGMPAPPQMAAPVQQQAPDISAMPPSPGGDGLPGQFGSPVYGSGTRKPRFGSSFFTPRAEGGQVGYFASGGRLRTHGGPMPTVDDYRRGKGPPMSPDGRSQHFAWAALIPAAMSMVGSIAGAAGKGGGGGGGAAAPAPSMPHIAPPTMAAPAQMKPIDFIPGDEPDEKMVARGGRSGFMRGGYPELFAADQQMPQGMPVRQGYFSTGGGSNYVRGDGEGNGRSDHIDALLSPGEYVMDAETVALLGDGDNEAGARKLDKLRKGIRVQKGRQLAKGEFSPQAKKNAEEYMARDAISDGFRQHGRG